MEKGAIGGTHYQILYSTVNQALEDDHFNARCHFHLRPSSSSSLLFFSFITFAKTTQKQPKGRRGNKQQTKQTTNETENKKKRGKDFIRHHNFIEKERRGKEEKKNFQVS